MLLFQALMVAALLVMGMGIALLGTIKVDLARRLNIDEARVGGLISLFGLTIIPVVFGAGFVTDELGKQPVLATGCLLVVASLVTLAVAGNYATALAGALLLGSGWSAMVNVGNVLTPLAFSSRPGDTALATNLANVFFGAGAFLTPLGLAWLIRRIGFTRAMLVTAALAALPCAAALAVDVDRLAAAAPTAVPDTGRDAETESAEAGTEKLSAAASLLANPVVWLCGLAFFCYFPMEASMSGWTTTLLIDRGISESNAARLFSGFWLAYLGARLCTALALPPGGELLLIVVLSAVSIAVLLGVTTIRGRTAGGLAVLAAGLCFGPIFPTLMAVLLDSTEPQLRGRAVGLAIACGGMGSSSMPLLIGLCARRKGLPRAFLIVVALSVGLTATALLLKATLG